MANTTISLGRQVFYPRVTECRDREDQAKASYNHPLRRSNHVLSEENMRLKRILRENGIFWSPISRAHIQQTSTPSRRGTRNSRHLDELELPRLPTEVITRIVKYALQSPHPIIDPLSRTVREHLTGPERSRGNQIAIHILATCRSLHAEGTRRLWESNTFVFTTPEALRHFAELSPEYRNKITSVNLRVIARYYDDRQRTYRLEEDFFLPNYGEPPRLLNILSRPKESRPNRGGLRSYSEYQLADFLMALRAPYDPNYQDKHIPRPRLLPSLSLLRIDFVNFIGRMWRDSFSYSEIHELACHELGCTLNELQITGLPTLPLRISQDLSSMLKDEGVFLEGCATYAAQKRQLQKLSCRRWVARVVRASVSNDDANWANPWECRDHEDQAKASYNNPLKRTNHVLSEENMRLKRILRENGISWSPVAQAHMAQPDLTCSGKRTRSSRRIDEVGRNRLPVEVILRILKYVTQSPYPIIDPLSRSTPEHLTEMERSRGSQIAIHILATCRALHAEGTRYLWESNTFVFTTPEALHRFAELSPKYRNKITSVTLRVIARYYDDCNETYRLDGTYHPDLKTHQVLKVHMRPKEPRPIRGGFRGYSWHQIADFLVALRAPYDPSYKNKHSPRPRLLPSLSILRLDLVNFADAMLPSAIPRSELHEVASHEFGCTLNELQITGMPDGDTGRNMSEELTCMLKDEGLFLHGCATYVAQTRQLQKLSCTKWCARVVRASVREGPSPVEDVAAASDDDEQSVDYTQRLGILPPAPTEEGHPALFHDQADVIWKRIPLTRDSKERRWVPFSRATGREMPGFELGTGEDGRCPHGDSLLRHVIRQD
ncbi:hypothetical protein E4U48_001276 [Claviceps purpurea]|nr:hypothetical protein E4U27_005891 [Claviceps purpurea]KAG6249260.1 hypothetical protein E4U23_002259 [Claviceps purpurea]KAG6277143.1 hypothetical protein E4U48_001276 [Claviceps purpurea]